MKSLKIIRCLMVMMLAFTASAVVAVAQVSSPPQPLSPEEITDEDLQMVVNISDSATGIQEEASAKIKEVVEREGMDFERFQEIVMSQQNPQLAAQLKLTAEEEEVLKNVESDLMIISQEAEQKYMETIENEGLSLKKFQQIAMSIQTYPEVAQRFEEIKAGKS